MIEFLANSYLVLGISIVAAIVTMISLEVEREGIATTAVSIALALVLWNYGGTVWGFVKSEFLTTVLFILGYLVLGVIWSFLKWNEKVKKFFTKIKKYKDEFIQENGAIDTLEQVKHFGAYLNNRSIRGLFYNAKTLDDIVKIVTPKGADNKSSIVAWISYWPLSLLATLVNNPFRRLFEYVYHLSSGLYDKISKNQAKNLIS